MIFVDQLKKRHGDDWPYGGRSCYLYADDPSNSLELSDWVEANLSGVPARWMRIEPLPYFELSIQYRRRAIDQGAQESDVNHFAKVVQLWKRYNKK